MAASGFNSILLYGSTTASATPSAANLTTGASGVELAINATDGKLFYKDNLGAVQTLATKSSVISPLTANGVVYVNGSSQATSGSALTFDGSTFKVTTGAGGISAFFTDATYSSLKIDHSDTGGLVKLLNGANQSMMGLSSSYLNFYANTAEQMRLTSTGLGIGTSSPGTKLDVNGTARIRAGNTLYFQNAAADANGTITASGGSGSSDLAINASGGNVGIGTSSPGAKLEVTSTTPVAIQATSNNANGVGLYLNNTYTGGSKWSILSGNVAASALSIKDETNNATRVTLDSSGNLGIGTTTPSSRLHLFGSSSVVQYIQTTSSGAGNVASLRLRATTYEYGLYVPDNLNTLVFYDYGQSAERMRIDSSGNLLVGTTSVAENGIAIFAGAKTFTSGIPQYQLQAQDTTAMAAGVGGAINFTGKYTSGGAITSFASIEASKDNATSGNFGAAMVFKTRVNGGSQTEAMRIDSSQNVGIGTSSPAYKLHVSAASGIAAGFDRGDGSSAIIDLRTSGTTRGYLGATTSVPFIVYNNAPTELLRIDSSGNLGIGTTSPGYKLQVSGAVYASGDGSSVSYYAAAGGAIRTVGTGALYIDTATTTGTELIFRPATIERMRLDTSGNLGIGTSSPGYKLQVLSGATAATSYFSSTATPSYSATAYNGGNARASFVGGNASGATTGINFSQGGSFEAYFGGVQESGGAAAFVWQGYSGAAYAERMRLDSSGNLGLGVTPSAWASYKALSLGNIGSSIAGQTAANGTVFTSNAYYNAGWKYAATAAACYFDAGNNVGGGFTWNQAASGTAGNAISFTQAMTLDASGNLFLGATSQAFGEKFQMYGNYAVFKDANYTGFIGSGTSLGTGIASDFGIRSSNAIAFLSGGATERARIDTSGNLLVGTTSVFSASRLTIQGNATYSAAILGTAGNTTSNALFLGLGGNRSTDTTYSVINYVDTDGTGTARFRVYGNGNVVNTNNSYGAISDAKLKENVTDATPKLDNLCKVRIVNYNLIGDEAKEKRIGVIAQELEQVFPSLVDESVDLDEEGNPTGTTTKAVKYSVFVPMLIKAMQEQQAMIEELKARIVTLENK